LIGQAVGNYRIVDQLGQGGMGVVYLAEHTMMGKKAAVKVLLPEYSDNKEVVGRFFNEAKAAARIRHPGIVNVFDFGYHESGGAYISMELLEGQSLAARLKEAEQLEEVTAVRIARQAARALSAAHKAGIIHRDLKPDNLFLLADPEVTGGERVKILDFGIAKLTATGDSALTTRAGMTMGTPYYMSPEQCRGSKGVNACSDIYSLGCVLYHMVCGTPPFVDPEENNPIAILRQHISEPPPPTSFFVRDLSAGLEGMLMVMLAKKPEDRFSSMDDLVVAFDQLGYDTGAAYTNAGFTPVPGALTSDALYTPVPGLPTPARHPTPEPVDLAATDPNEAAAEELAVTNPTRPAPDLESAPEIPDDHATRPQWRAVDPPERGSPTTLTTAASQVEPDEAEVPPARSKKLLPLLAGAFVVVAGGVGLIAMTTGGDKREDATKATSPDGTSTRADSARVEAETASANVRVEPIRVEPEEIRVTITSTPAGAQVFRVFDGVRLGQTPFETVHGRGDGELLLMLKRDGYRDARLEVPLDKNFSAEVELLAARSDSRRRGERNGTRRDRRSSRDSSRNPSRDGSDSATSPPPIAPLGKGTLRVASEPSCEVIVDGKARGSTPVAKIALPAGSHTLQLVNSRFGIDRTYTIEIEADKVTKKRYTFPAAAP